LISLGLLATFGTVFVINVRSRVRSCNSLRKKNRDRQREREKESEAKEKRKYRGRDITFKGIMKRKGERDIK